MLQKNATYRNAEPFTVGECIDLQAVFDRTVGTDRHLSLETAVTYLAIVYNGEQVSVPKEVADFLEQDRKREQAQEKQDARHLSKSEFETVLSGSNCVKRPVEDAVLRNLRLENLWGAIAELDVQGQNLLSLRYSDALTMDGIGQSYGISKMAVSKRLKKLHEKLGSSVS